MSDELNFNRRSRNWFLCIHENAPAWDVFMAQLDSFGDKAAWAYIFHDPESGYAGEYEVIQGKPRHVHIVIGFDNPRTFMSMKKHFPGAHIEISHNLSDCAAYLLHNTPRALEQGKKQYDVSEIATNNRDVLSLWLGSKGLGYQPFNAARIIEYVYLDGLLDVGSFYLRFGDSILKYLSLIDKIINEFFSNVENQEASKKIKAFLDERKKKGIGYNRYSADFVLCRETVFFAHSYMLLIDLVIRYQRWDFLCRNEDVEFLFSDRFEICEKYKIADLAGMDVSVIRVALLKGREDCL